MNVIGLDYLRSRGVPTTITDDELLSVEERVWQFIENFCNQFFEIRSFTMVVDGPGDQELYLAYPIISITSVSEEEYGAYDMTNIKVYNRRYPDDRDNPKVVNTAEEFTEGFQNITIVGSFGYVDPDTLLPPSDLMEAAAKIIVIFLEPIIGESDWVSNLDRQRLIQEQTDKWMYKFSTPQAYDGLTGYPDIDKVLVKYRRNRGDVLGAWV